MDIIIKNGLLVTASDIFKADIGILNGKIAALSENLTVETKEEIDATNMYVFPGFIDAHTHLELPITETTSSVDDFYTGTVAAAIGGTTSIIDYIVPYKNQTLTEAFHLWQDKAKNKAIIDYGFHMTISDPSEKNLDEVKKMPDLGVTSIKCFTAYVNKYMMTDDQIYRLLKESLTTKALLCMHCENGFMIDFLTKELINNGHTALKYHPLSRPPILEEESIGRVIDLAKLAHAPIYIAHLSTGGGLERIISARNSALKVYAETCPQYLLLADTLYEQEESEAAKYICSPPLRSQENLNKLWHGLLGSDIQVFATDHCPFNLNKERQHALHDFTRMPNGLPGIEDRVNILFSEGVIKRNLDLNRFIDLVSTQPAKIFGMYPKKGGLNINADADIVIYNPDKKWTISARNHHQNVDYNVYEGLTITGKPEIVLSRGEIIVRNNKCNARKGRGNYLKRNPSSVFLSA